VNRRNLRWVGRVLAVLALAVWFAILRPQWLGGPAMYLVVRGDSMLPTYQNGDLLVIMNQEGYSVGYPAAYRVPAAELGAGRIVVHRVITIGDRPLHHEGR
jgi:signal peptidase I